MSYVLPITQFPYSINTFDFQSISFADVSEDDIKLVMDQAQVDWAQARANLVAEAKARTNAAAEAKAASASKTKADAETNEASAHGISINFDDSNNWQQEVKHKFGLLKTALDKFRSLSSQNYRIDRARVEQSIQELVLELVEQSSIAHAEGHENFRKGVFHSAIQKLQRFFEFQRFAGENREDLKDWWPASVKFDIELSKRHLQLAVGVVLLYE